jgi:hypothetical protein
MTKSTMTSKRPTVRAYFEGLSDELEQYRQHFLMRYVQGYPRSHWKPSSGNYLLHITPAAASATAKKTIQKYGPVLLAILMTAVVHWHNTVDTP